MDIPAMCIPVLFRVEASNKYGLGHLYRCYAFAEAMAAYIKPFFIFRDSTIKNNILRELENNEWKGIVLSNESSEDEDARLTSKYANEIQAKLVVTDLCHEDMITAGERLINYHRALKQYGVGFVLSIEDLRVPGCSSNMAIIPYPCDERKMQSLSLDGCKLLAGSKYYIIKKEFSIANKQQRIINRTVKNIMVCMGGADPKCITSAILKSLSLIPLEFNIRVILGEAVLETCINDIKNKYCENNNTRCLYAVNNMVENYLWADLAIIGEGLIKYEAIITGTPSIMLSQFDHGSKTLNAFLQLGTLRYLGEAETLTEAEISSAILDLIYDYHERVRQSKVSIAAIDGNGMERIVEILSEERIL